MSTSYRIKHSHGLVESGFKSHDDAATAVRSVYGDDIVIGHDGDISMGGQRTLCWPTEKAAQNDDGARACCSIVASHDLD